MINEIFKDTMANMKWTDIQDFVDKNAIVLLPMGVIEDTDKENTLVIK